MACQEAAYGLDNHHVASWFCTCMLLAECTALPSLVKLDAKRTASLLCSAVLVWSWHAQLKTVPVVVDSYHSSPLEEGECVLVAGGMYDHIDPVSPFAALELNRAVSAQQHRDASAQDVAAGPEGCAVVRPLRVLPGPRTEIDLHGRTHICTVLPALIPHRVLQCWESTRLGLLRIYLCRSPDMGRIVRMAHLLGAPT